MTYSADWRKHHPRVKRVPGESTKDGQFVSEVQCPHCNQRFRVRRGMKRRTLSNQRKPRTKLGRQLWFWREELNVNSPEAAELAGVSYWQWRKAERDGGATPKVLAALRRAGVIDRPRG